MEDIAIPLNGREREAERWSWETGAVSSDVRMEKRVHCGFAGRSFVHKLFYAHGGRGEV